MTNQEAAASLYHILLSLQTELSDREQLALVTAIRQIMSDDGKEADRMRTDTLKTKITYLASLKDRKRQLADETTEVNAEIDAWEKDIISDMCDMAEAQGFDDIMAFKIDIDGRRYGINRKTYYTIRAQDRPAGFAALRALGLGDLIVERLDDRSLTKALNQIAEQHDGELPPEYATIPMQQFDKDTISDRKVGR